MALLLPKRLNSIKWPEHWAREVTTRRAMHLTERSRKKTNCGVWLNERSARGNVRKTSRNGWSKSRSGRQIRGSVIACVEGRKIGSGEKKRRPVEGRRECPLLLFLHSGIDQESIVESVTVEAEAHDVKEMLDAAGHLLGLHLIGALHPLCTPKGLAPRTEQAIGVLDL